jgi:hypothetical protein
LFGLDAVSHQREKDYFLLPLLICLTRLVYDVLGFVPRFGRLTSSSASPLSFGGSFISISLVIVATFLMIKQFVARLCFQSRHKYTSG